LSKENWVSATAKRLLRKDDLTRVRREDIFGREMTPADPSVVEALVKGRGK